MAGWLLTWRGMGKRKCRPTGESDVPKVFLYFCMQRDSEKRSLHYFRHNFYNFRHGFVIFDMNHPDNSV